MKKGKRGKKTERERVSDLWPWGRLPPGAEGDGRPCNPHPKPYKPYTIILTRILVSSAYIVFNVIR